MKKEKIKQLLTALGTKQTGYRNGWVLAHCPLVWRHGGKDANPSFAVKDNHKKKSICKCLSCGYGGDLEGLVLDIAFHLKKHPEAGYDIKSALQLTANEFEDMELNPDDIPDYDAPHEEKEIIEFPQSWLDSFHRLGKFPEAVAYVRDRGVTEAMEAYLDLRFDPLQQRIGFPFRDFKGRLMGIQGRQITENSALRYYQYGYKGHRNMAVWMGEDKLELDKPVVLVEGPFDYSSVLRLYPNVAASFTSGLSKAKVMRMADAESIITLYDYGKGGDAARELISKYLPKMPITHLIPSEEEDDAGAMSIEQVALHLTGHVKLSIFGKTKPSH